MKNVGNHLNLFFVELPKVLTSFEPRFLMSFVHAGHQWNLTRCQLFRLPVGTGQHVTIGRPIRVVVLLRLSRFGVVSTANLGLAVRTRPPVLIKLSAFLSCTSCPQLTA